MNANLMRRIAELELAQAAVRRPLVMVWLDLHESEEAWAARVEAAKANGSRRVIALRWMSSPDEFKS